MVMISRYSHSTNLGINLEEVLASKSRQYVFPTKRANLAHIRDNGRIASGSSEITAGNKEKRREICSIMLFMSFIMSQTEMYLAFWT